MPVHSETRYSPFLPEQLYHLVADIAAYPLFLPWCAKAEMIEKTEQECIADLTIRFKLFQERYRSKVIFLEQEKRIKVTMMEGPFYHLTNEWWFEAVDSPKGRTLIHFDIDFKFRSRVLEMMIGGMFEKAMSRLSQAFEARARALYK